MEIPESQFTPEHRAAIKGLVARGFARGQLMTLQDTVDQDKSTKQLVQDTRNALEEAYSYADRLAE